MHRPSMVKVAEGLAEHLGVPVQDEAVLAVAYAVFDASRRLYQVASARYGSVKLIFEDGWIKSVAFEMTDLPDPENRRPAQLRGGRGTD